jgi:hypothetical protein
MSPDRRHEVNHNRVSSLDSGRRRRARPARAAPLHALANTTAATPAPRRTGPGRVRFGHGMLVTGGEGAPSGQLVVVVGLLRSHATTLVVQASRDAASHEAPRTVASTHGSRVRLAGGAETNPRSRRADGQGYPSLLSTALVVWFLEGAGPRQLATPPLRPWYEPKRGLWFADILRTAQRAMVGFDILDPSNNIKHLHEPARRSMRRGDPERDLAAQGRNARLNQSL